MSYAQRIHQGIDPLRSMANKGGGGGSSTTVQSIPEELKPLATQYTKSAIDLSNQPYQAYTGKRFAGLNPTQYQGMGIVANRALNGDATVDAGANYLQRTLNGQIPKNAYAGANPYLENAINRSMDDVQTRVNSQFSGSNYGTSANQEVLARELGNVSNQMRMQDYTTQQGLAENALNRQQQAQMGAAQMGLNYGNQAYQDASQLFNVGSQMQDQLQQQYDFNYQQFLDKQNLPYKNLAAQSGVFGSNLGSTSTTQQSGGGK